MMERSPNFIYWQGGDNTRLAGKMQVHNRLAFDGEGRPMLQDIQHMQELHSDAAGAGIRCAEAGGH